ncbi:hypothetical protein [Chitinophaga niabensis]|uniref:Uncharacterized protein n=1 Tax=Chitinophaga niabensis TaxID=536979 RepID=A0A1N6KBM7_9BACT|nr:hypothetical protein [Chitinophaga niabensis]SIO53965.1 hypothetical protein SAMN04488055_5513 [Chitinophaga niabensis]
MKKPNNFNIAIIATFLFGGIITKSFAQDSISPKITTPFKQLPANNLQVTGNPLKKVVTVKVEFKNEDKEPAEVYLKLGGFENFGVTVQQDKKYKIHSKESFGTRENNKGFGEISFVRFGNKALQSFLYLQEEINPGSSNHFSFTINGVNPKDSIIDLHIRCNLSVNQMLVGDKLYKFESIKINWIKPKEVK